MPPKILVFAGSIRAASLKRVLQRLADTAREMA